MRKLNVGHIGWLSRDEGPDCATVAWCDINEAKLQRAGAQQPDITLYTDYREMVKHPGLDLVVISTPNFVHAEQACAFLDAGKHVFLEKPMGVSAEELDRILVSQQRSGKNLAIDFEMRISPFAQRAKTILDSGELGELRRIEFIHHRGGWLEEGNGIWRTRPEKSGGLYFMEPIHEVDIFRYIAGEIVSVQSTVGPNVMPQYRFQDHVCSHFFFQSGVVATILTSHTLSAVTKDASKWTNLGHDMRFIFTCSKGTMAVDMITPRILVNHYEEYPKGSGGYRVVFNRTEDYTPDGGHAFSHDIAKMRREFIRRCAEGLPPIQDALDAWKTHRVCLAAEASVRNGFAPVAVDYALPDALRAVTA